MMLKDFKQFIVERNILEITAAIVMGNAFSSVMTSLINDILTPVYSALVGHHDLHNHSIHVGKEMLHYGTFFQAILNFIFVALIFFIMIRSMRPLGQAFEKNIIDPLDETLLDPLEQKIRSFERNNSTKLL